MRRVSGAVQAPRTPEDVCVEACLRRLVLGRVEREERPCDVWCAWGLCARHLEAVGDVVGHHACVADAAIMARFSACPAHSLRRTWGEGVMGAIEQGYRVCHGGLGAVRSSSSDVIDVRRIAACWAVPVRATPLLRVSTETVR